MLPDRLLALVADVVSNSTRERPADGVLRELLRENIWLSPGGKREVSRTVFTYYRWRGWLGSARPLAARIRHAIDLDERFRRNPFTLPEETLRAKALPEWVDAHCSIPLESLRTMQREPRLWVRARPGQAKTLAAELRDCLVPSMGPCPDAVEYRGTKDLHRTEPFRRGAFEIQDISSQAVAVLCDPRPGESWWDVCAGEGGKALHLSDLLRNRGLLWATDRAGWRLDILRRRAARAGCFNYRAASWQEAEPPPVVAGFDGVLVDAPCSGLGTWQRNPHARWTCRLEDVRELATLQSRLLTAAASGVRPGGKLVYSVCTMTREETTRVADAFCEAHPDFESEKLKLMGKGRRVVVAGEGRYLTIWPHDLGGNGMFVAAWRRLPT